MIRKIVYITSIVALFVSQSVWSTCWLPANTYFNGTGKCTVAGLNSDCSVPNSSTNYNFKQMVTASAWVYPLRTTGSQTIINKWYALDSYILLIENGDYVFGIARPDGSQWGKSYNVRLPASLYQSRYVRGDYNGNTGLISISVTSPGGSTVTSSKWIGGGNLQQSTRPVVIGNHPSWNVFYGYLNNVCLYGQ